MPRRRGPLSNANRRTGADDGRLTCNQIVMKIPRRGCDPADQEMAIVNNASVYPKNHETHSGFSASDLARCSVISSEAAEVSDSGYLHKKFNKKIASSSEGEKQPALPVTQESIPPEAGGGGAGGRNAKDCESDPNCKNKPGRYICSYCQHACAKPSVLEKHIRAHTNERPYPCVPCGFAFKTKSNLYKHRKSRTHVLKMEEGGGASGGALHPPPDDLSQTSDTSDENEVSDEVESDPNSSQVPSQMSPSTPDRFKTPYKPKFHTWKSVEESPRPEEKPTQESSAARRPPQSPSPGFLQARISQIISENQAIVESSDPIWARRFVRQSSRDKDSIKPRTSTTASTVLINPKTQPQVSVSRERSCSFSSPNGDSREVVRNSVLIPLEEEELHRKRCYSEGRVTNSDSYSVRSLLQAPAWQGPPKELQEHVNPEGSLIKDLLLKSRMAAVAAESNRSENSKASLSFSVSAILQNGPDPATQRNAEVSRASHVSPEKNAEKPVLNPDSERHSPAAKRGKFEAAGTGSKGEQHRTSVLLRSFSMDPSTNHSAHQKNEPRPSSALDYRPPQYAGMASPFGSDSLFHQPPSRTSSLQLCGGEVEICEGDKKRVMRIDPVGFAPEPDPSSYSATSNSSSSGNPHDTSVVVMKPKSGLNTGGGTVQVQSREVRPITSALPLTLVSPVSCRTAAANSESGLVMRMDSQSAFSEVSKTRIPYVPGIPGPYSAASALSPAGEAQPSFALPASKSASSFVIPEITVSPAGDLEQLSDSSSAGGRSKFLRPNTLPLKPGTFQLKKTNMAGVDGAGKPHLVGSGAGMTLVSPETPRPHKLYRQMFLNGHAYTYLGLKCSTRVYFCCLSKPQPMYVHQGDSKLSMYSQWQTRPCPADSSPCGLSPVEAMGLYDSRHHTGTYTVANPREGTRLILTHSSYWTNRDRPVITTASPVVSSETSLAEERKEAPDTSGAPNVDTSTSAESSEQKEQPPKRVRIFAGGFKSNEDYTYVRGRGRGRYVCEECGIRCKKPSMLKKHIRTHTDLRPYTCRQCNFSFKTKGNLTKHMKSKAHHKKCTELGISPVPTSVEESNIDEESLARQEKMKKIAGSVEDSELEEEEDDEDEDDEDMDEEEDEADCDSGSAEAPGQFEDADEVPVREEREQEVARSLLDLGVIARAGSKPTTYPYAINNSAGHNENPYEEEQMEATPPEIEESAKNFSPMDLTMSRPPPEALPPPPPAPQEPQTILSPVTETSSLLASIYMTAQRAVEASAKRNITPEPSENEMLHAYIKEKALKEGQIKRQQLKEVAVRSVPPAEEKTTPAEVPPSASVSERVSVISSASSIAQQAPAVVVCSSGEGMIPKPRNESSSAAGAPLPQTQVFKMTDDGKTACSICNKVFTKPSQLRLHINIHYFERPFRCDSCAVSFRTKGHLQKHKRSVTHFNKVNMNLTFGTPSTENPRPFKCSDCMIAFRIHGHLAKHLRSKMHIMKLECLGKLPFGTYAEIERSGVNLNEIDTTDCHNSLESLQSLAHRLYKQDPGKLQQWQQESADASGRQRTISGSSEEFSDLADEADDDEDAEDSDGLPCPDVTEALRVEDPAPLEATDPQSFTSNETFQSQARELYPPAAPPPGLPSTPPPPPAPAVPPTVQEPKTSPWRPVPEANRPFYPPPSLPLLPRTDGYPPYMNPMSGMRPNWTQDPNAVAWMASRGLMLPIPMPGVGQMHGYLPAGHLHMMNGAAPHAEESLYPCELCGKTIAGKEAFHQHMMTHAQPRPFVCEYCDAGFTTQQHLESHLTLHRQQAN